MAGILPRTPSAVMLRNGLPAQSPARDSVAETYRMNDDRPGFFTFRDDTSYRGLAKISASPAQTPDSRTPGTSGPR